MNNYSVFKIIQSATDGGRIAHTRNHGGREWIRTHVYRGARLNNEKADWESGAHLGYTKRPHRC
jgi:hypothetical protein